MYFMDNYGIKKYNLYGDPNFSVEFDTRRGGYILGICEAKHFINRRNFQNMLSDKIDFHKAIEEYDKSIVESLSKNKLRTRDLADIFDVVKKFEDEEYQDFKIKGSKVI